MRVETIVLLKMSQTHRNSPGLSGQILRPVGRKTERLLIDLVMLSKQLLENLTKSHLRVLGRLQLSRGKRSKRTSICVSEGLEKLNASRDGRPDRIADDAGEESVELLGNTANMAPFLLEDLLEDTE